jgi:hypothetical protein
MRDILDLLQNLNESTGLAGRKPGDLFRNSQGDEITFTDIKFFPEQGGKYDPEELDQVIDQIEQQSGGIEWQNAKNTKTGGFGIATFNGPSGIMNIGRYLESVKPNIKDNYIPNTFGDFKYAGKAAAKIQSGLSPQDLLGMRVDLDISDIMNQLAMSLGTDNPLYAVAHRIATGTPLPVTFPTPEGYSFTAFRDYFCEILQPIALQKGQWTGNAGEAAQKFLGGSFENTLISFDESKTAGLSDSILTNDQGQFIKVSSKGGKGATASAKNLLDTIEELKQTKEGKKLLVKYKEVVDLLNEIKDAGQAGSPIMLGLRYGIIDEKDAKSINELKNVGPVNLTHIATMGLSKNLQKLANGRGTDNPDSVNLYYHLIAAVAHKAADEVNKHTNFSKAAAEILNNGALVQVYTKAKENKDSWTLGEFTTVYPGDSIRGVYLSAGKTYYSTAIKGNFTFKIDKGSGVSDDADETDSDSATPGKRQSAGKSLEKTAQNIVNPIGKEKEQGLRSKRK